MYFNSFNLSDLETTGLNPEKDKIITFQSQLLPKAPDAAPGPLRILKIWDFGMSEKSLLSAIIPSFLGSPWKFIPVGNNLIFDFKFLAARIRKHFGNSSSLDYFVFRPHLDLKTTMILMNNGKFTKYSQIMQKKANGSIIPELFHNRRYDEIISYVKDEADAFVKFYSHLQRLLPGLIYRRLDEFV